MSRLRPYEGSHATFVQRKHGDVAEDKWAGTFRSRCICGWVSTPPRYSWPLAVTDGDKHLWRTAHVRYTAHRREAS